MLPRIAFASLFVLVSIRSVAAEPPNIIYVMLDDAGYGDFGAFGSQHVQTPVFDRMCREGTKFTHHHSGSAVCAPTRCVLMTGLHTGHCRRRDNRANANKEELPANANGAKGLVFLKDQDITIAEVLKRAGYATGGIGKWGLGNSGTPGEPTRQGFDMWYGYLDQVHAHNHYTDWLWDSGKRVDLPGNRGKNKSRYSHDLFEQRTLEFIRQHQNQPFFLYLAYTLPHGRYVIPHDDPAYAHYKDKPWSQQVKNYAAMITRADRSVGKVLRLLDELGLDENTIVFYTSDNGPNRQFIKPLDSNGPFRGTKRELLEGGIRAAMAVRWPGKIPAGRASHFPWGMRDFFRTACDLAGTEPPKDRDGLSVVPILLGQKSPDRGPMYWEFYSGFQQAVRLGPWKGIRYGTEKPIQLYHLKNDPGESNNLASKHPEIVTRIQQVMQEEHKPSRYFQPRK